MNATTNRGATQTVPQGRPLTLEQQRAQHAWRCVREGVDKDYVGVAKALPQLIMNSGLMQTLAFMKQKGGQHEVAARQLRAWLQTRLPFDAEQPDQPRFERLMDTLLASDSATFRLYTAEALAWLKWLRQFASAQQR